MNEYPMVDENQIKKSKTASRETTQSQNTTDTAALSI